MTILKDNKGYTPKLVLDAANGVGANKVKLLIPYLENLLKIDLKNDGTTGKLNYQVRHVCQPPKF
jgi:phosphoacetylglucosamine mutase